MGPQTLKGRTFIAGGIDANPTTDFNPFSSSQDLDSGSPFYYQSAGANITQSPLMNHVWQMASAEFAGRFGVPLA